MKLKQFMGLVPIVNTTVIMNVVALAVAVAAIGLIVIVTVGVRMLLDLADDWSSLYKQD